MSAAWRGHRRDMGSDQRAHCVPEISEGGGRPWERHPGFWEGALRTGGFPEGMEGGGQPEWWWCMLRLGRR